jgi:hypothetical protein
MDCGGWVEMEVRLERKLWVRWDERMLVVENAARVLSAADQAQDPEMRSNCTSTN